MLRLSDQPENKIRAFAKQWMKLLADGQVQEACALLDEPNSYGIVWTPEKVLQVVHDTFSPETRFYREHPEGPIFTNPNELPDQPSREEVVAFDDGTGYSFDCDVPLNHEWSDLTAQFVFLRRPNGYAVILHDLHVM